ncbi:MAG: helix-hairpin-helix domain-containing protein [Alcanivoracaceae bacterium]|nr:helix-hairpin-helix domain-containing protein [Alcanivoracaceae bacterium]
MNTPLSAISLATERDRTARAGPLRLFTLMTALILALVLGPQPAQAQQDDMPAPASQSVNINSDEASVLSAGLTGVGLSRAEDIIRYREEFGPFTTIDQLSEVKGIGKATLDKNRARITLD